MTDDSALFARLAGRLVPGGELVEACRLAGGVSAAVTRLTIAADGGVRRYVVREHGALDRARNPRIAAFEFDLLSALFGCGLPVPRPVLADDAGTLIGRPLLVLEHLAGETEDVPADEAVHMAWLARGLVAIHEARIPDGVLSALPHHHRRVAAMLAQPAPDDALRRSISDALASRWPPQPRNRATLLHADYWPGNVLWRDGAISGIIDWEDAALGDPLADLAVTRLELAWAYGAECLEAFTASYLALRTVDTSELPLFQLAACLDALGDIPRWGLDPTTRQRMLNQASDLATKMLETLPRPGS